MRSFGQCERRCADPILIFQENRSRMEIFNPARLPLRAVIVDGCAITSGPRCDFLVITPDQLEIYIELKGAHVGKCEQLLASIRQLSASPRRVCYIVSSRFPRIATDVQKYKKQLLKEFNAVLTIKNSECQHTVSATTG